MLREAMYYTRMSRGVYHLLRAPGTADPEGTILAQLANRERHFLETVRRVIFADPEHPYHRMFQLAGCSYEDLKHGIERDGLESTLAALHRTGVCLSHDEFKCKKPIIRSGHAIPANHACFLNPLVSGSYEARSSGSRSAGTVTRHNLQNQLYRECYSHFLRKEFDLDNRALIGIMPILPSAWGLGNCLKAARGGRHIEKWFAVGGTLRDSGHYRAVTKAILILARLMGAKVPFPTYLKPDDFSQAAEWLAKKRQEGIFCWVNGVVSACVRVAADALDNRLDIRGTLFRVSGEALTEAKRRIMESAGAEVFPYYHIHELGPIGQACRQMREDNCVHIQRDAVAVISYRRMAPLSSVEVNSLLFTSLLPFAPRVLINVEMDDAGVIGPARCDCVYRKAGFVEQISEIHSFGKLTGHGITLVGGEVVRILEEILPQRFGGAPGDYQLVEADAGRRTDIILRVSPRSGAKPPDRIKEVFLDEVRKLYGGSLSYRQWKHSGAVNVVIGEPFTTTSGKILPLHLLGLGGGNPNAS
ncbi:MAG: hypothetical protein JXA73_00625 [Acidobacteria bacterium]|nr:hypothetical protein [Acidobacteriota bacterium]